VKSKLLVIAGPTACGKSLAAVEIARSVAGAVVVNADSMQVYKDIPIVTSQPDEAAREEVEHKLYSICEYDEKMNAAKWAGLAAGIIRQSVNSEQYPIIVVGGTGMYIDCLVNGISELPEISAEIRKITADLAKSNYKELCDCVYRNDEKLRNSITPDKHRQMQRAHEILLQTGLSIRSFFEGKTISFLDDIPYRIKIIDCRRDELYARINTRFRYMIENGAIEEIENLLEKTKHDRNYPLFQAIGVREICDYVEGKSNYETMIQKACTNSRHYAKRQYTWFRRYTNK
jgi:tRNA dimethylallyltransferase